MRYRATWIPGMFAFAVLVIAFSRSGTATAGPGLVIGVDDESLKWTEDTAKVVTAQRELGAVSARITLLWEPGQQAVNADQATYLRRAQNAARMGQRIVLAVYGPATAPPLDKPSQDQFCGFVSDAMSRARNVRDVVIWNEVNSTLFWKVQRGPPAAYVALLAGCYDTLHARFKYVNVISSTAPHENPGPFIAAMGIAFRESGRTAPLFDTFGHDAYPEVSTESPLAMHPGSLSIDQADYVRLMSLLTTAFDGTWQVVPGRGYAASGGYLPAGAVMSTRTGFINGTQAGGPVTIWYLEDGFETVVPAEKRAAYGGRETNRQLVQPVQVSATRTRGSFVAPNQAAQLKDALELAYCQPAVGAWFNFELQDEVGLAGWQSGLLYADGTQKASWAMFKAVIASVASGSVDCTRFSPAITGSQRDSSLGGAVVTTTTSPTAG